MNVGNMTDESHWIIRHNKFEVIKLGFLAYCYCVALKVKSCTFSVVGHFAYHFKSTGYFSNTWSEHKWQNTHDFEIILISSNKCCCLISILYASPDEMFLWSHRMFYSIIKIYPCQIQFIRALGIPYDMWLIIYLSIY